MKNCGLLFGLFLFTLISCSEATSDTLAEGTSEEASNSENKTVFSASLRELSDKEYPDNPDITVRHDKCVETTMNSIEFVRKGEFFDVYVIPDSPQDDTAHLFEIDFNLSMEFNSVLRKMLLS